MSTVTTDASDFGGSRVTQQSTCIITSTRQENIKTRRVTTSRISTLTPNYRAKLLNGTLPENPFSYTLEEYIFAAGVIKHRYSVVCNGRWEDRYYLVTGSLSGISNHDICPNPAAFPAARLLSADREAISSLLIKVKDQRVNLGQVFAERMQTVDLITNTVKSVAGCITNLRKGNFAGASRSLGLSVSKRMDSAYKAAMVRSALRAQGKKIPRHVSRKVERFEALTVDGCIANGWLALQYGWKPLLSDVQGMCEVLYESRDQPMRVTVRSKKVSISGNFANRTDGVSETYVETYSQKTDTRYKCTFSAIPIAHAMTSLGITNPLTIAWELMPFSFVVDWFLPVGNFISSLDATNGLTFEKGSKTVFSTLTTKGQATGKGLDSGTQYGSSRKTVKVDRTVLLNFPSPTYPQFKNPLSFYHNANAISLLIQSIRK